MDGESVLKYKVFDRYDYENFYDKRFESLSVDVIDSLVKSTRGVAYTTATIKSGNQLEVEIYPSFRKVK